MGTFSSLISDSSANEYNSEVVTVKMLVDLFNEVSDISTQCYELNRERASEAIVFLVADLDRSWEKEKMRSAPVAWFPKGYSLKAETMRMIAEEVCTKCHEHNIHISCESFDGQWHSRVVRTKDGYPQTRLQLQKDVWHEVEKKKKATIVLELKKINTSPRWKFINVNRNGRQIRVISTLDSDTSLPTWRPDKKKRENANESSKINTFTEKTVNLADVLPEVITECSGTSTQVLSCTRIDDLIEAEAFSANVNEQLWAAEIEDIIFDKGTDEPNYGTQNEASGDIVGYDADGCTEIIDTVGHNEHDDNSKNRKHTIDTSKREPRILITETDASHILSLFKITKDCNKKHKWDNVESVRLLEYFTSTKNLKSFLYREVRVIVNYLKKSKNINIKESGTKQVKINELAKVLGLEQDNASRVKKGLTMKPLKDLAVSVISRRIPKHELNVTYAEYIWPTRLRQWEHTSTVRSGTQVNGRVYNWFYIPEFSKIRQQLEVKCIDSTHLLTRTRRKSCKGGDYLNLTNEAWMKVAKSGNSLLTPIMIEEVTDPMSVDMATTHFSEPVETIMRKNSDEKTANLCHDIRNWWYSEDKAGIQATERIELRAGLRKRLLSYVNFGKFPPPGSHIYGWPMQLWEAVLANIDAKALLYSLCHAGTYNVRAFSSMIGETFFSELTLNDKRGQGTVTSEEFGRFICNSVEQLHMRLDPERSFAYTTKRSTAYRLIEDVHTVEHHERECDFCLSKGLSISANIETRNHIFDTEERKRLPGRRRDGTVSTKRNATQKGALGVRWEKARTNTSKMLPSKRMGIEELV